MWYGSYLQLEALNAALNPDELVELVEQTYEALDDVWKNTDVDELFPQQRMQNLMTTIDACFVRYAQHQLSQQSLWSDGAAVDIAVR